MSITVTTTIGAINQSAIEQADTLIHSAKQILISNRVQQFTAADVVALAKIISDRDLILSADSAE
jgi:hypothetical protein